MLRLTQSVSANGATKYFDVGLATEEYYTAGVQSLGIWGGRGADELKLGSEVDREAFSRLANGLDPRSGKRLTARLDTDRRPGYDFTFSVPKSVSVIGMLGSTRDKEIVRQIFDKCVLETMRDIEAEMQVRVRGQDGDHDCTTGNMVWAKFDHDVTRPVDGLPDPHIHSHVYVFNLTKDGDTWKAGQFGSINTDAEYWEQIFESKVAAGLQQAGYGIERTAKGWEVASISTETVDKFSRRTQEIEKEAHRSAKEIEVHAQAIMVSTGNSYEDSYAQTKAQLGLKTRQDKKNALPREQAFQAWSETLGLDGRAELAAVTSQPNKHIPKISEAVHFATSHAFANESVLRSRALQARILKAAIGSGLDSQKVEALLDHPRFLSNVIAGQRFVTTSEVLNEENRLVSTVRNRMGVYEPFAATQWAIQRTWLNQEQRDAVQHILFSRDLVTGIRGFAGTGKTTMLQEAVEALELSSGKKVFVFAPSRAAVDVLRGENFKNATTIAALFDSQDLINRLKGNIILIDETGLTSIKDFRRLIDIALAQNSRIILAGDRNQHRAVERGDTLRILEKYAGLKSTNLVDIRRQQFHAYNSAVRDLAAGNVLPGFQKLDDIGFIREIEDSDERRKALLESFLGKKKRIHNNGRRHTVLMIAPTHAESETITAPLRGKLQASGVLSGREYSLMRLQPLDLTEAQKADAVTYQPGIVIEPNYNIPGARKGERFTVLQSHHDQVSVHDKHGQIRTLALLHSHRWSLYEKKELPLQPGDQIRVTKNQVLSMADESTGKRIRTRLTKGDILSVRDIVQNRLFLARSGAVVGVLDASHSLHVTHGYVVTSHASQGKNVDHVLVSQPVASFRAVNREQFYVSVSRGKWSAEVFTDSKEALKHAIQSTDARMSASDFHAGELGERVDILRQRTEQREAQLLVARQRRKLSPSELIGAKSPVSETIAEWQNRPKQDILRFEQQAYTRQQKITKQRQRQSVRTITTP